MPMVVAIVRRGRSLMEASVRARRLISVLVYLVLVGMALIVFVTGDTLLLQTLVFVMVLSWEIIVKGAQQNPIQSLPMESVNVTMVMLTSMVSVLSKLLQLFNAMSALISTANFKNVSHALMDV